MDDAIVWMTQSVKGYAVFVTIGLELLQLQAGQRVLYRQMLVQGWGIVIGRGEGLFGAENT